MPPSSFLSFSSTPFSSPPSILVPTFLPFLLCHTHLAHFPPQLPFLPLLSLLPWPHTVSDRLPHRCPLPKGTSAAHLPLLHLGTHKGASARGGNMPRLHVEHHTAPMGERTHMSVNRSFKPSASEVAQNREPREEWPRARLAPQGFL